MYVKMLNESDDQDPTKYQTEEDRAIIRKLIENYITDKRTIILLVIAVKNLEFCLTF